VFHRTSGTSSSPVDIIVKFPRCPKKHRAVKAERVEIYLHAFTTSALNRNAWSVSHTCASTSYETPPPPTLNFDLMSQKCFCPMELLKWDDELSHRADTPISCQQNTLPDMFLFFRIQCWDMHISTPVKKHAFSSNMFEVNTVCRFY
jgi:hypothetical protein